MSVKKTFGSLLLLPLLLEALPTNKNHVAEASRGHVYPQTGHDASVADEERQPGLRRLRRAIGFADQVHVYDHLTDCSRSYATDSQRRVCIDQYLPQWQEMGIVVPGNVVISSVESAMLFELLECSLLEDRLIAQSSCILDKLLNYQRQGVDVRTFVNANTIHPIVGAAQQTRITPAAEFRLAGIIIPTGEAMALNEVQFYLSLMECSAMNPDDITKKACMDRYLEVWQVMGIIIPRFVRFTPRQRIMLMDLLTCSTLQTRSPLQVHCLAKILRQYESNGVAVAAFVGTRLTNYRLLNMLQL